MILPIFIKESIYAFFHLLPRLWSTILFSFGLSFITSPVLATNPPSSVAVFDWTIAETILSLNPGPVLMGNVQAFHTWTGNDYADADITNIGIPLFPNMELLSNMAPDHIILSPQQIRLIKVFADIAPSDVAQLYPYTDKRGDDLWTTFDGFTREVGELTNRRDEAEQLITETQSHLQYIKEKLDPQSPLLIVQLITEQYVRVYGDSSIFHGVLQRLGLSNAWTGKTDQWGRSLVSIRELFNVEEARLVIIENAFPIGIENNIENSGMWRYLPSVQRGDFIVLPTNFWIAGAQPSALRFADTLVEALEEPATP